MTIWAEDEADHHLFRLTPIDEDPTRVSAASDVFDVGRRVMAVHTGVAMGPVTVGMSVLAQPPATHHGDWDNVAQATIETIAPLYIVSIQGDVIEEFDPVEPPSTGYLRVRVSTQGRASNWDDVVDSPTERYLIELWPTELITPPEQLKSTDGTWQNRSNSGATATDDPSGTDDATVRLLGPSKSWVDDDGVWHTEDGTGRRT